MISRMTRIALILPAAGLAFSEERATVAEDHDFVVDPAAASLQADYADPSAIAAKRCGGKGQRRCNRVTYRDPAKFRASATTTPTPRSPLTASSSCSRAETTWMTTPTTTLAAAPTNRVGTYSV